MTSERVRQMIKDAQKKLNHTCSVGKTLKVEEEVGEYISPRRDKVVDCRLP